MVKKFSVELGDSRYTATGFDQFEDKFTSDAIKPTDKDTSSQMMEDVQDAGVDTINAFRDGIDELSKLTEASAKKKEDGALVDLPVNVMKSMSVTVKALADVPSDFYDRAYEDDRYDGIIELPTRLLRRITDIFDDD